MRCVLLRNITCFCTHAAPKLYYLTSGQAGGKYWESWTSRERDTICLALKTLLIDRFLKLDIGFFPQLYSQYFACWTVEMKAMRYVFLLVCACFICQADGRKSKCYCFKVSQLNWSYDSILNSKWDRYLYRYSLHHTCTACPICIEIFTLK